MPSITVSLLPKRSYAARFQIRTAVELPPSSVKADSVVEGLTDIDVHQTTYSTGPTIAVLPLVNMSLDPEQEHLADGVTEDLITNLSKHSGISVIARQSTFSYKGAAVTVQQVCDELDANIVLECSVRKIGDSVRITAQLIDGPTGQHLWAQRYGQGLGEIFDVQDEVNQKSVSALSLQLTSSECKKLERRRTDVIDAYDYVLRGMKEAEAGSLEGCARARYCFESALELDTTFDE